MGGRVVASGKGWLGVARAAATVTARRRDTPSRGRISNLGPTPCPLPPTPLRSSRAFRRPQVGLKT